MRRLAAELGCGVMTLYTYVRDREDLLSGVVGLLIAEVETGHMPGSSWQEDVRRAAASYRAMALRHPRAFPALALAPSSDPGLRAHVRRIVDGLKEGGFDEADGARALQRGRQLRLRLPAHGAERARGGPEETRSSRSTRPPTGAASS